MFNFDKDDNFDLMDLVEADIQYGLFEDDDKLAKPYRKQTSTKPQKKNKSFLDMFKV